MKIEINIPDNEALHGRIYFTIKKLGYDDGFVLDVTNAVMKALGVKDNKQP